MTSALERDEGSASLPGRTSPPGKTRYPLYRRLGGPQGRSGQVQKISPPPGFDPRTVQPLDSRYTDYATRPTILKVNIVSWAFVTFMILRQNHYNTIQYHYTLYVGRYTSFRYTHLFSRNQNLRMDSSVQGVHTAMMVLQKCIFYKN